jgi:hypothetical protein
MDSTKELDQILLKKLGKSLTETLVVIRQAFAEESKAVRGKSKLTEAEKQETGGV